MRGKTETIISLSNIPDYDGEPYVVINDNEPSFDKNEITTKSFETYSTLDGLGRCGTVEAAVGEGVSFHVYCYNVQPGVEIDYSTGDSRLSTEGENGQK